MRSNTIRFKTSANKADLFHGGSARYKYQLRIMKTVTMILRLSSRSDVDHRPLGHYTTTGSVELGQSDLFYKEHSQSIANRLVTCIM